MLGWPDRRRAGLQRGRLGLPRAAHAAQGQQARGDLRARLLHGGRHDRAPGARARHHGAAPGRRRLGLAEAARDRRRGARRLATTRTTTRSTTRARSRSSSRDYKTKLRRGRRTRWPRSATTRRWCWPTPSKRARQHRRAKVRDAIAATQGFRGRHRHDHHRRRTATPVKPAVVLKVGGRASSSTSRPSRPSSGAREPPRMETFLQQLVNGLSLGSHLRPDRARLHDGLRHPAPDQLRARRRVHGRRVRRLLPRRAAARDAEPVVPLAARGAARARWSSARRSAS